MSDKLNTCHHLYDDGGTCNSAAVTGQNYCAYHLRYRARQLRNAQIRARNQRFDLKLPPLEDMFAVQSALNQIVEAAAADMIDLKRAQFLLSALRAAGKFLLARDKWPARIPHSDQPVPATAVDLAAEYGLPRDLDLATPPDVAFPQTPQGAPPLSPDFGDRVGVTASPTSNCSPTTDNCFSSPMPTVDYCDHGPGCPEHTIRVDYPETPELAELREIKAAQGMDAAIERYKQQQRNHRRREVTVGRKRYAAIALEKNMRLAAERLAEQKLAERETQEKLTAKKPPASVSVETVETSEAKEVATA